MSVGWGYVRAVAGILAVAGLLIAACVSAHQWNGVVVVVFIAGIPLAQLARAWWEKR